jgi:hypothetical protein
LTRERTENRELTELSPGAGVDYFEMMNPSAFTGVQRRGLARSGLRLGTLVLWIGGCAVGFAFYAHLTFRVQPQYRLLSLVYNLVMGTVMGTTLTGAAQLRARSARGDATAFAYPGHWLLVLGSAVVVIDVLFTSALSTSGSTGTAGAYWVVIEQAFAPRIDVAAHQAATWGFGMVATVVVLGLAGKRLSWAWRGLFAAYVLAAAYMTTTALIAMVQGVRALLAWSSRLPHNHAWILGCGAALLVLIALIPSRHRAGDGLHWLAFAMFLATAAIQLVLYKSFF